MTDLVVRGGRVVTPGGVERADVAVTDGAVAAIDAGLEGGREEIDATGLVALPGAVDAHVHLGDPGRAHWEGFATGTRALAAGGTTCAVDMPLNALPPTVDAASFAAKVRAATGTAHVDVALWGGLVPDDPDRLQELAACGVVGFKAFMSASGLPDFPAADEATLLEGMRRAATLGLPVAVHAESDALTARLAAAAVAAGRTSMRDYLRSRPVAAELEAIGFALALAGETGAALHVVHVSCGRGVRLIAEARAQGLDVTCETCPHYLVLDEDDAERLGAVAKCAPPLRAAAEREALWAVLMAGDVDTVGSDHSPAPAELKAGEDMFAAWGGISGAQTLLALLLDAGVHGRGLPLEALAGLSAGAPARRLGLAPGKVEIALGADADLVLVDLAARERHLPRGAARPSPPQPLPRPRAPRPGGPHAPARGDGRPGRPGGRRADGPRAARAGGDCPQPGSTDSRGESAPWPRPYARSGLPKGTTLRVRPDRTSDRAHDTDTSTMTGGSRLSAR